MLLPSEQGRATMPDFIILYVDKPLESGAFYGSIVFASLIARKPS